MCELACSQAHTGLYAPSQSRVRVHKDDESGLDYPNLCRGCPVCPPVEACPTKALSRSPGGWLEVDSDLCTACWACVESCRYQDIFRGWKAPLVCDHCGGAPRCVAQCPTAALEYGDSPPQLETVEEAFQRLRGRWGLE